MDLIWQPWGIETPQAEWMFHPTRKWRFDYGWIKQKIAVEIDGGVWSRGRHTRGSGYVKDMEKMNEATRLGWRVFKFQPKDLKNGVAQAFIKQVMEGK